MLSARHQQGLGLVELLVGVAIALVLLTGASLLYVNTLRGTATSSAMAQVNQSLRAMAGVIEYDLRRAGYWENAAAGIGPNPFMVRGAAGTASTDLHVSPDQSCVLYTFDRNSNGRVDADEFFGFWFDATTRRLMVLDPAGTPPVTSTAAIDDCARYGWQPMNFPGQVRVDRVTFSTGGSQCVAYAPDRYNPASAPGSSYLQWSLDTGSPNWRAGCDTVAAGANQVPAGTLPAGTAVTIPPGLAARAEVRQVIVTLTATHARDAAATRTLATPVRLRNDRSA